MRNVLIGLLAVALIGWAVFAINQPGEQNTIPSTTTTQYAQIQKDVSDEAAKLYDVRTAEEFAEGHFAGAINLSLQDIEAGKLPEADKETNLYLYCRSGNRSAQAAQLLKDAGYANVVDLGGLGDVQAMGGKLTTTKTQPE